jgi:hypothetical protein
VTLNIEAWVHPDLNEIHLLVQLPTVTHVNT